jgi:carboxypeptidase Taq
MQTPYEKLRHKMAEVEDLNNASAVLNWDQEVYMPPKGASLRSRQLATLGGLAHDLFCSDETGELLEQLESDPDLGELEKANVREVQHDYRKARLYSRAFVERMSMARSQAFLQWRRAREASEFGVFREALHTMVDLKREEAALLGYGEHPYDALMDAYERGARTSALRELFEGVRTQLLDLSRRIAAAPQVNDAFLRGHFDKDAQWQFGLDVLRNMGYDFEAGRQDISAHPFTTSFGPLDVRVTTRVDEANFKEMLWSCIHEGGHALYEQGLPSEQYGMPLGVATSLGIHESQSRIWENNVGRGLPFWKAHYPGVQQRFPGAFSTVSLRDFYRAINKVQPSLIRTEADEISYHFHIMIRFEIEVELIEGSLSVSQLRDRWNEAYREYLGLEVPDDKRGVLQDIHWSHGSIGYFPTYSLGSFYAAQFYRQACLDLPGLEADLERGDSTRLLAWLRENIHRHGRRYTSSELCERITGKPLEFEHFLAYAEAKYGDIYGL